MAADHPPVLLISGTDTASDLWHADGQKGPTVYDDIQKTTRVCAYDRPGAPHLDQTFSRSDPVLQPTSPQNGVNDLVALLKAADAPGPYVLVAHSFSGTIARVFAGEHPDEVKGIVFVDVLTPELRAQMTPEEWKIWKRVNARPAKALAAYPDLERQDFDETLNQTAAAAALRPMPVVVLTASDKFIDVVPKLIQAGELPPDTPPDFGAVVDRANSAAQNELAALVPGENEPPIAGAMMPSPMIGSSGQHKGSGAIGKAARRASWRRRACGPGCFRSIRYIGSAFQSDHSSAGAGRGRWILIREFIAA